MTLILFTKANTPPENGTTTRPNNNPDRVYLYGKLLFCMYMYVKIGKATNTRFLL